MVVVTGGRVGQMTEVDVPDMYTISLLRTQVVPGVKGNGTD